MKFKVSSNEYDHLKKSAIIAEVNESTITLQKKRPKRVLPADYWEFLPKDELLDESCIRPNRRVLSHAQVSCFLVCTYICCLLLVLIKCIFFFG